MFGNLVPGDAVVTCPHGGRMVAAAPPGHAVRLDGVPLATTDAGTVTGCPHDPPCTTIRWTPDGDGVRVDGVPVLLDTTAGQCFNALSVPQGPPRIPPATQQGVRCR
jgi:hypothetical protein